MFFTGANLVALERARGVGALGAALFLAPAARRPAACGSRAWFGVSGFDLKFLMLSVC